MAATQNINAEKIQGSLSILSVSATTYQNLPTDIRVTGGTYNSGTGIITFTNNTGGTFTISGITTVSGNYLPLSGGTVSGDTTFTNYLYASTVSATTYQNVPVPTLDAVNDSGGQAATTTSKYGDIANAYMGVSFNQIQYLDVINGFNSIITFTPPTAAGGTLYFPDTAGALKTLATTDQITGGGWTPTGTSSQYVIGDGTYGNIADLVTVTAVTSTDNSLLVTTTNNVPDLSVRAVIAQIRNETGSPLTKGQAVYLSGASGNKALAWLAKADAEPTSSGTIGLIHTDIPTNQNGYAVINGQIQNLDTTAFSAGTKLWLSASVAGGLTSTIPSSPNHPVMIGVVSRSHANQGTIELNIMNTPELRELSDVSASTITNGQTLIWDSVVGVFKPYTLTDIYVTGATKNGSTATFTNSTGGTFTLTGLTDVFVTGGTYNSGSGVATFTNNTGGTFTVTGFSTGGGGTFTGGTVAGPTTFTNGLTANTIVSTGDISGYSLVSTQSSGDEGGEVRLATAATNNSLSGGSVTLDIFQNKLRIFETGSPNRGAYIDLTSATSSVGTNLLMSVANDTIWDSLGDIVYGTGADTAAILSGNTSSTKKFLTSQGSGGLATAPTWGVITAADVAGILLYQNLSIPTSGGTFTPTPSGYRETICGVSGLSATLTVAAPPAGTYVDGDKLVFRIADNGTLRTLSFSSAAGGYIQRGATVPTSTITINKWSTTTFLYNSLANKWDCVGYVIEF